MKPLNLDNKPCSPISSNCVVWQGPDIPCINLCTGDTVSDVVSAMATELCTILDTLKVSNYDLTCFNLQACGPEDFQALIQFLITKICELEGVTPETKDEPTCPDCVVSVAECFVTGNQTTMQLVDYVQLIGERICSIITEISLITAQITDILIRLTDLENAPAPTFTIPTVDLTACDLSATVVAGASYDVDLLLSTLINDSTYGYCALISATGLPADIISAVTSQEPCISESISTLSNPGTPYGAEYPTWVNNPATIADSIINIWLTLCDIHTAVSASSIEILDEGVSLTTEVSSIDFVGDGVTATAVGDAVTVTIPGTSAIADTGWVDLEGFEFMTGSAAALRPQCRRIGNAIHFRGFAYVPLTDGSNIPLELTTANGYDLETAIAPATGNNGTFFGVTTNGNGSLEWNQGNRVIPSNVLDPSETLDGTYRKQLPEVMSRIIRLHNDVGDPINNCTQITAAGVIGILSDGSLYFGTLKDQEIPSTFPGPIGTSALRFISSNIRVGEFVPNYINVTADIHNLGASGASSLSASTDFSGTDYKWPFSCDTGEEDQLGAFRAILDGLVAFVDCNATPATADCNTP